MTPELRREADRSMIVIAGDGRHFIGGRGVLYVLELVGWHPRLARLAAKPPFVWLVDAGYRLVASHRQFFSRFLFRRR